MTRSSRWHRFIRWVVERLARLGDRRREAPVTDHLDRLRFAEYLAREADHLEVSVPIRTADLAALLSERDALAAVAEAARALRDEWDMWADTHPLATHYRVQAEGRVRDALAAYDRTVAKP